MYYTINDGRRTNFSTWWEMIGNIKKHGLNNIAHNYNDIYKENDLYFNPEKEIRYYITRDYNRTLFVYDCDDRIVNLSEIREGIKQYKEQPKKVKQYLRMWWLKDVHFIYRYDPVPDTGKRRFARYFRKIKKNKNYYASLLEYKEYFPASGRLSTLENVLLSWGDDHPRTKSRSWKDNGRKAKQWE